MKPAEVVLREALASDAGTLALLGAATFLETYAGWLPGSAILENCRTQHTVSAWTSVLEKPGSACWLATIAPDAAPIGFALVVAHPEFPQDLVRPGDHELKRLYLFSRFHGTGTGQELMDRAIDAARRSGAQRLLLGTHTDNTRALRFYGRNHFQEIGRRVFTVGCCRFDDPVLARHL